MSKKFPARLTAAQEPRFTRLWLAYGYKVGKGDAIRAYVKYDPSEDEVARWIGAVKQELRWRAYLKSTGQFVPERRHLATWINGEFFDNEYSIPQPVSPQRRENRDRAATAVGDLISADDMAGLARQLRGGK